MSYNNCYRNILRLIILPLLINTFLIYSIFLSISQAQITLDGSMGPSGQLTGPDYDITSNLGQIRGSNLFHSFGEFNVLTGESATFSGPNSIANILGRVTGGNLSFIDGLLASTIPGANLYMLNPAGVLFGPNASLDVSGSFHVSTADYLSFEDGAIFHADLSRTSTLTVAETAAFGFLSGNPSGITINGSFLEVPDGKTLSVVGGGVEIDNGYLYAPSGQTNIASVASPGEVIPNATGNSPGLHVDSFGQLGEVSLSRNTFIDTSSSEGGGTVVIRGGRFMMDNSVISANTLGNIDGATTGVDVQITQDMTITNGSFVVTDVEGAGNAGNIQLTAKNLNISNGSTLGSRALPGNTGNSGDIDVQVDRLSLTNDGRVDTRTFSGSTGQGGNLTITATESVNINGSLLVSNTYGKKNAGSINIHTGQLSLTNGGQISTGTRSGSTGQGGNLTVTSADSVTISGGNSVGNASGMYSASVGSGEAGKMSITANTLKVDDGGLIQSVTFGSGNAGQIDVHVNQMNLTNRGLISTGTRSGSTGHGGNLTITVIGSVNINDSSGLFSDSLSSGNAGSIDIHTGQLSLTNGAQIGTGTFSTGNAGTLTVTAKDSVTISGKSSAGFHSGLYTSTFGSGNAGELSITANTIELKDGGQIGTSARSGSTGQGGNLTVTATDSVTISGSGLFSNTFGSGAAGKLSITAKTLEVKEGGQIVTSAREGSTGTGGDLTVTATDSVTISGDSGLFSSTLSSGYAGRLTINSDTLNLDDAQIDSRSEGKGNAGQMNIHVNQLNLTNGGQISTGAFSTGNAGALTVTAEDSVTIRGKSSAGFQSGLSSRTISNGLGGDIELQAGEVQLANEAVITASSTEDGNAGDIMITVRNMFQSDNSTVLTFADKAEGGDISITSGQDVQLRNGTLVSAESSGAGDAGKITINAGNTYLSENSLVTTEAKEASGGDIQLTAGYMTHLINSEISSSVKGGSETKGGNITMNQQYGVLDNSKIIAQANEGSGGNIQITAEMFLADPNSVVSASSARGIDGAVDIRAPVTNISGSIGPLQSNYQSAASLLLEPCAVRMSGGQQSSLVIAEHKGLSVQPGDLLPSPLYDASIAGNDAKVAALIEKPALSYGMNVFEEKGLLPLAMSDDDSGCSSCPE